jgi:nicotinic acid mononucleotide adenylyltransferase
MKAQPILDRPGSGVEVRQYVLQNLAGDRAPFYLLPGLHVEISASQVREQIRRLDRAALIGKSAEDDLLPEPVFHYIRAHGLYR